MEKLRKLIVIAILVLFAIIFMQKHVQAFQYGGDIRIQKVWDTEQETAENRRIKNNKKIYLKSESMLEKTIITGILISCVVSTYLVISKDIKLKNYYIFLVILAIIYFVVDRYLVTTYLPKTANVTGIMYVKIMLITVGVLIGIFAQGKVQKILMSSTPAFIVLILGLIGSNMKETIDTAMLIELFIQIILIPQYCMRSEKLEE